MKTIPVNGGALRQRLLDMGCSDRDFAGRTGVGLTGIRTILLRGGLHTSVGVGVLDAVLRESGMSAAEFLDRARDTPVPDDGADVVGDPGADAAMLVHVLVADRRRQNRTVLARALEWDYRRLGAALAAVDTVLAGLRLEAHQNEMGVALRPLDDRADAAVGRLARLRDLEDGIPNGAARVLHALWTGALGDRAGGEDLLMKLGALRRRGLVVTDVDGRRLQVSDDVLFALEVI